MKIQTRNDWRATRATAAPTFVRMKDRTHFIVHHSGGPAEQSVRDIQNYQMEVRGFSDIGYNFLIRGTTGELFEGRGWNAAGAHTIGQNYTGLGVCIIGNDQLSDHAKASLRDLYTESRAHAGHTLMITGHRDHDQTLCPGRKTYTWIRSGALDLESPPLLRIRSPRMTGPAVRKVQKIVGAPVDGIYGPQTERLVRSWQAGHDLLPDGIVGPKTWAAMGVDHV